MGNPVPTEQSREVGSVSSSSSLTMHNSPVHQINTCQGQLSHGQTNEASFHGNRPGHG